MTTIRVEVTGEEKRAASAIHALAIEIAGVMGFDGVKLDRSTPDHVYLVLFRTQAQANRFCRAVERFVPATLARIYPESDSLE
jgi:hypothetical protein